MCVEGYIQLNICPRSIPIHNAPQQGDALFTELFNFAIIHAITNVHENQEGFEVHYPIQILIGVL
jgi:hypothetical protein